jgi:hypothetical protein
MSTIININIGGSPLFPNESGERAFKYLPNPEPIAVTVEEFDFLSEREFTPRYYVGLTPIPDQVFARAKNCKKGQACGNSCISLAKTCKKNLTPGQKPAAKNAWVKTKSKKSSGAAESATQAGKGAVETAKVKPAIDQALETAKNKGGKLALLDKPKAEQTINAPRFAGDRQIEIDKKYNSENPTDKDIAGWKEETIKNYARTEALESVVAMGTLFEAFPVEKYVAPYLDKVKDEASFTEAYVALKAVEDGKRKIVKDGKTYTGKDVEYWQAQLKPFPEEVKKYEQSKKILDNPKKTEAQKAKAQKEIDKYEANLQRLEDLAVKHQQNFLKRQSDKAFVRDLAKEEWAKWSPDVRADATDSLREYNTSGKSSIHKELRQEGKDWFAQHVERMVAPDFYFGNGTKPEDAIRTRLMGKTKADVLGDPQTKAELKKTFKDWATQNHPDKGGDTALFQTVSAKYNEMLSYLN